jgi:hypothetical protein
LTKFFAFARRQKEARLLNRKGAIMPEHPAEIPAESEGGGGGGGFRPPRGGIGGPNELSPYEWTRVSLAQLVSEIFRLRNRLNTLENTLLAAKLQVGGSFFGGGIGGPNELPEGGGGGFGGGHIPHEIHEINELPISRFAAEISSLVARFAQFERSVSERLGEIAKRLNEIKR